MVERLKAALLAGMAVASMGVNRANELEEGFRDPPAEARPRVWWHWLNGAISQKGIQLDLEWMQRAGIGGVQIFTGEMPNNSGIIEPPIKYMSHEWKAAFRKAVRQAGSQGMEVAIPTSPGWSETGAPFVKPADGMKKLVWSEIELQGGRRFKGHLPLPPKTSGPFATVEAKAVTMTGDTLPLPEFYADALVIAYRVPQGEIQLPMPKVTVGGDEVLADGLLDGKLEKAIEIDRPTRKNPGIVQFDYPRSVTLRSIVLSLEAKKAEIGTSSAIPARLEVSHDGENFRKVADVAAGDFVQNTTSFAPVKGRHFRVVIQPAASQQLPVGLTIAPGALLQPGLPMGVSASKLTISEMALSGTAIVNRFEEKAGFASLPDYYAHPTPPANGALAVKASDVINLSARMEDDGALDWTPPKGRWRVLRLGYSLTGHTNGPAPVEATGLEVDKLDAFRVRNYMRTYLDEFDDVLRDEMGRALGLNALLSDSYEAGHANWTDDIIVQFQKHHGYDPTPYLPALTGQVVESAEKSDAFLYDFRTTLMELLAEAHYRELAQGARKRGLTVYGEALEADSRPVLGDDIAMRRYTDVPMGAMWTFPRGKQPASNHLADVKGAASVANLYGQRFVGAESMTSMFQPWNQTPRDIKHVADTLFANGVNRIVIHSSVHQPLEDASPGIALWIFGQYFNRNETWAEQARGWIDYLARTSWMLSQGRYSGDVAYFYGEEAPLVTQAILGRLDDTPKGYGFDYIDAKALIDLLSVERGELITPAGGRYRILQLGGVSQKMTLPVLRKIALLVRDGATIVGNKPVGSPSLADDPILFHRLADTLWAGGNETYYGAGRVLSGKRADEVLLASGLAPDHAVVGNENSPLQFNHRLLKGGHVWFVSNPTGSAIRANVTFRVTGFRPELWDALSGTIEPLSYRIDGEQTTVPLDLGPSGAALVVFRHPTSDIAHTVKSPELRSLGPINGPWAVTFQSGRGAPDGEVKMELGSWAESDLPSIRYFSGTATYKKIVIVPPFSKGGRVLLDLGEVADIAEIEVNGKAAGMDWLAPYRIDVTDLLRPGPNDISVKVTNRWVNRLIGDAQPDAKKIGYTVTPTYSPRASPRPSGLLGPVKLIEKVR